MLGILVHGQLLCDFDRVKSLVSHRLSLQHIHWIVLTQLPLYNLLTYLHLRVGASVLREGVYSTFRIGAYEPVKELLGASHPHSPLWKKIIAGAITGSIGSTIANPTDLVKIRMQGEGKLPPGRKHDIFQIKMSTENDLKCWPLCKKTNNFKSFVFKIFADILKILPND